jgi:hypothetical protein
MAQFYDMRNFYLIFVLFNDVIQLNITLYYMKKVIHCEWQILLKVKSLTDLHLPS